MYEPLATTNKENTMNAAAITYLGTPEPLFHLPHLHLPRRHTTATTATPALV